MPSPSWRRGMAYSSAYRSRYQSSSGLDVVGAVAQRRQLDPDDVEAVVQVGPELALLDQPAQAAVGGGDEADVHRHRAGAAHGHDLPLLEQAQQLGLEVQGDLADLVQQQRAALGRPDHAQRLGSRRR